MSSLDSTRTGTGCAVVPAGAVRTDARTASASAEAVEVRAGGDAALTGVRTVLVAGRTLVRTAAVAAGSEAEDGADRPWRARTLAAAVPRPCKRQRWIAGASRSTLSRVRWGVAPRHAQLDAGRCFPLRTSLSLLSKTLVFVQRTRRHSRVVPPQEEEQQQQRVVGRQRQRSARRRMDLRPRPRHRALRRSETARAGPTYLLHALRTRFRAGSI